MAIAARFDLAPEKAVEFFLGKKELQETFDWRDMLHQHHDRAFTIAKMMDVSLLGDVKQTVDAAIAEGWSFERFRSELTPMLISRGWWGRQEMVDPETGEAREVQLGSARRLRVIYDTNLRTSYAAGHWSRIDTNADTAPYVMYSAVLDDRTRPEHAAWNGKVLRHDDAWWQSHTPPNGWNCRCTVIQLSERDLKRLGKDGPDEAPPSPTREWTNPRTGEVLQVPAGVDPGWGYAPGAQWRAESLALARDKLEAADPQIAAGAIRSLVASEVFRSWAAKPEGAFPIGLLSDADAKAINAPSRVVDFTPAIAAKQAREHKELVVDEYHWVQDAIERGRKFKDEDGAMRYVLVEEGYVSVVAASYDGLRTMLLSFRRLSTDAVKRDRELRRLLGED